MASVQSRRQSIFTQQAEYIDKNDLLAWAEEHPAESDILRKLTQSGAKLITGPRGCGKTTLLKKAYYGMVASSSPSAAFPVYVNYKASLKLEPLYTNNSNAVYWFNQWLLAKVYAGIFETADVLELDLCVSVQRNTVEGLVGTLELGRTDLRPDDFDEISLARLELDIEAVLSSAGKNRCVLLLDDAAHAFSPQQQKDFFEFFRAVKSRNISPKAAIYPGITVYSPAFHVGHDADEIDVWIRPEGAAYIEFMVGLLKKRLPHEVFSQMIEERALLELVCYAAFGVPRALLNMVNLFYKEPESKSAVGKLSFDRNKVRLAVRESINSTLSVYGSLSQKMPIYDKFVAVGADVYQAAIKAIKDYNKDKLGDRQAVDIGIAQPIPDEMKKVLGFLRYSGLLMHKAVIRRGDKGTYEVYTVHYGALINSNALLNRQSLNVAEYVNAFANRPHSAYPRIIPSSLIRGSVREVFLLALPPCPRCNTPRTNQDARYCLQCGAQLKMASVFESLVNQTIDVLPISGGKIRAIKEGTRIRTIKDVLMDFGAVQLRSVRGIGRYWADRIVRAAEEAIA